MFKQAVIRSGPLELRPLTAADQALFVELYTNPKIMRQVAAPLSAELAARSFALALQSGPQQHHYYWTLWPAASTSAPTLTPASAASDNTAASDNSAMDVTLPHHSAAGIAALIAMPARSFEFGVMILPAFSGRGIPVAALAGVIQYAFMSGQAETLIAKHQTANLPVVRLLRRLRVTPTGTDAGFSHWQLTKSDWQQVRQLAPYADVTFG